jgi:adenylate cyclase
VHLGTVVYGNVGASSRLDFTVMGQAVNLLARIQHLTGETGEALLFSKEVAEHLPETSESLGVYKFKEVSDPVELFKTTPGR